MSQSSRRVLAVCPSVELVGFHVRLVFLSLFCKGWRTKYIEKIERLSLVMGSRWTKIDRLFYLFWALSSRRWSEPALFMQCKKERAWVAANVSKSGKNRVGEMERQLGWICFLREIASVGFSGLFRIEKWWEKRKGLDSIFFLIFYKMEIFSKS